MKRLIYILMLIPFFGMAQYDVEGWKFLGDENGSTLNGEEAWEYFGMSTATSEDGNIVAVGAPYNSNDTGYVKVYQRTEGNWVQIGQTLVGQSTSSAAGMNVSLSADGTIVAFSEHRRSANRGQVRVFRYEEGAWVQMGATLSGEEDSDFFGHSISLSSAGTKIAIGAISHPTGSNGYIKVFSYTAENGWEQQGETITGETSGDWAAKAELSGDGNSLVVAARQGQLTGPGYVKSYTYDGTEWVQKGQKLSTGINNRLFGSAVSINEDGNIIAVNERRIYENDPEPGKVRMYSYDDSADSWNELGQIVSFENRNWMAISLSSNGKRIALGDHMALNFVGEAKVLEYNTDSNQWNQIGDNIYGYYDNYVYFGTSVSLSGNGNILAAGATPDGNTGNVYVYEYIGDNPSSIQVSTLEGEDAEIYVGETLQLVATAFPEDTDQEVIWSVTSGADFVSIDDTGLVMGLSAGVAVVRATSVQDSSVYGEIEVTVLDESMLVTGLNRDRIRIYPNPVKDILYIETGESVSSISVFDLSGRKVSEGLQAVNGRVDVSSLSAGTYVFHVNLENNKVKTFKILKK